MNESGFSVIVLTCFNSTSAGIDFLLFISDGDIPRFFSLMLSTICTATQPEISMKKIRKRIALDDVRMPVKEKTLCFFFSFSVFCFGSDDSDFNFLSVLKMTLIALFVYYSSYNGDAKDNDKFPAFVFHVIGFEQIS